MKVKPEMLVDDFMNDRYLGCSNCGEHIYFSWNPKNLYGEPLKPILCHKCGVFFDWSEEKNKSS